MNPRTITAAAGSLTIATDPTKPATPVAVTGQAGFFRHTIHLTVEQAADIAGALAFAIDAAGEVGRAQQA